MSARHLVGAAAAVAIAIFVSGGCQTHPEPSTNSAADSRAARSVANGGEPSFTAPDRAAGEPSSPDAAAALPEALSRKTAAYAQSIDAPPRPAKVPAAAPSSVQWGQPHAGANSPDHTSPASVASPRVAANAPAALPPAAPAPTAHESAGAANPPGTARPTAPPAQVGPLARSAGANALGDVPAIVPEASDFGPASAAHPAASVPPAPDSVESQVTQRVKEDPHDVAAQLDSQLLLMMKDQPVPQLAGMPSLSSEDQELVNTLVDGLTNFRTAVRQDANMLLVNKIRPLLDMADRLRTQAELSVSTVALCRKVDGFGRYDPIIPARFPAGQENPMLVYCEIENFASRHNSSDQWETSLSQQVTLFTDMGMLVWKDKSHEVKDVCRNRRHDFFLYDLVRLPANLTIGRYILKVTIVDRSANRVAEKTVPVEITAGGDDSASMASSDAVPANDSGSAPAAPKATLGQ